MENQANTETSYSLYYILAVVIMAITSFIYVGSIGSIFVGAIIGLLMAAFFVNVLVKDRGES
jgi:hypothetical protein